MWHIVYNIDVRTVRFQFLCTILMLISCRHVCYDKKTWNGSYKSSNLMDNGSLTIGEDNNVNTTLSVERSPDVSIRGSTTLMLKESFFYNGDNSMRISIFGSCLKIWLSSSTRVSALNSSTFAVGKITVCRPFEEHW